MCAWLACCSLDRCGGDSSNSSRTSGGGSVRFDRVGASGRPVSARPRAWMGGTGPRQPSTRSLGMKQAEGRGGGGALGETRRPIRRRQHPRYNLHLQLQQLTPKNYYFFFNLLKNITKKNNSLKKNKSTSCTKNKNNMTTQ
ncbi:hypothetical protein O3M35_001701 [Rhynocoris fuscipes]|uniref:Secreted protein n=1 Tax=Rhynocoris fuscipes TaxID=488301 RepID=A0AAW1CNF2_9HEMI